MTVAVRAGAVFEAGMPKALFVTHGSRSGFARYAVSDGSRFLVETLNDQKDERPITVILNWPALLNRSGK